MPENNTKTILIVEDDPMLSLTLSDACKEAGYNVKVANDGEEGLKIALEEKPVVILLDIMMPKMDGMTVLKNLNAQQPEPKSRVFMFTNVNDVEKISEAIQEGAVGYFMKAQTPIKEILSKVKEQMDKSGTSAGR